MGEDRHEESSSKYELGEVVAVFLYKNDILVSRRPSNAVRNDPDATRDEITRFSDRSRRRLAFVAHNADVCFESMITLTYPDEFPCDGADVKYHLDKFLKWLRYHFPSVAYLWFLEFQKRGAPHIHIIIDQRLPGCRDRKRIERHKLATAWYNIVDSNDERHILAGTSWSNAKVPDGIRRYAVKYASKMRQKIVPDEFVNVGRFWGRSRNVICPVTAIYAVNEKQLRLNLADWEYLPDAAVPIYRTLYNASDYYCPHNEVQDSPPEGIDSGVESW